MKAFDEHPEATVVGGNINEFIPETSNVVGSHIVPEKDEDIKDYLKSRCPLNLVTVMYKKTKVQEVGGFIDWYCEEGSPYRVGSKKYQFAMMKVTELLSHDPDIIKK